MSENSLPKDKSNPLFQGVRNQSLETGGAPTPAQLSPELDGMLRIRGDGFLVRTEVGAWAARKLAAGSGIAVSNRDGVSGDPTITVNVSRPNRLLGRVTAGAGNVEEIACTAAARALFDDEDAPAQRVTIGVIGTNYTAAAFAITPPASLVAYQNTTGYPLDVIISSGTVTAIEFSRDGVNWYVSGLIAGVITLSPLDRVRVTYTVVPTMTGVPR